MTFIGTIADGKVLLPPEVDLPDGVCVEVSFTPRLLLEAGDQEDITLAAWMKDLIGSVEEPADLAAAHDLHA